MKRMRNVEIIVVVLFAILQRTRREMGLINGDTFNKYFTVFILTTINLLNYMDRFTIAGN